MYWKKIWEVTAMVTFDYYILISWRVNRWLEWFLSWPPSLILKLKRKYCNFFSIGTTIPFCCRHQNAISNFWQTIAITLLPSNIISCVTSSFIFFTKFYHGSRVTVHWLFFSSRCYYFCNLLKQYQNTGTICFLREIDCSIILNNYKVRFSFESTLIQINKWPY